MRKELTYLIDDLELKVDYTKGKVENALDSLKKGDADSCSAELEDVLESLTELAKELY